MSFQWYQYPSAKKIDVTQIIIIIMIVVFCCVMLYSGELLGRKLLQIPWFRTLGESFICVFVGAGHKRRSNTHACPVHATTNLQTFSPSKFFPLCKTYTHTHTQLLHAHHRFRCWLLLMYLGLGELLIALLVKLKLFKENLSSNGLKQNLCIFHL